MKFRILSAIAVLSFFSLNCLITENITHQKNDVILAVHHSSTDKYKTKDIYPVYVTVTNQSKKPIAISNKSVNGPLINDIKKINKVTLKDMLALAGAGIMASTGAWALESLFHQGHHLKNPFTNLKRYPVALGVGALSVATLIAYPFVGKKVNKNLLLQDQVTIQPGDVITKILFMDSNAWDGKLIFKVYDAKGSKVVTSFNMAVPRKI